ncbi:MAG: phage major capsid protein [bacterium]
MPTLRENREKFEAEQKKLAGVFAEAKDERGEYDFTRVKSLGEGTTGEKLEKVRAIEADLEKQWDEIDAQLKAEESARKLEERAKLPVLRLPHPDGTGAAGHKDLGRLIFGAAEYKSFVQNGVRGQRGTDIHLPDFGLSDLKRRFIPGHGYVEVKSLFETGAGWAPESVRLPGFVEAVTTPPEVIDIIPTGRTGQASVVYMEETTRTHAAAEKAEGAAYAESTFVLTQRTQAVSKITDSVPVTDEQLEDVPMAESYLGDRLRFGLRQRASQQCVSGNGVAPNIKGILNFTGIQSQAKGADPTPDAIYKAMTLVRVTGRATPTHVILHPNDWEPIRLLRTADGIYIWGNPSEAGPERIWGLPVINTSEATQDTGIVGSFLAPWITLFERRGIDVQVGYINTQFTEGERTIRADLRAALVGFRGAAFCKVTGI